MSRSMAGESQRLSMPYRLPVAVCCRALQCVTVCCSVLYCAAVCCSTLAHWSATWTHFTIDGGGSEPALVHAVSLACCSVLQCVAVCCRVWQGVAGCCRVLQGVAGCCRVLQGVAGRMLAKLLRVNASASTMPSNRKYSPHTLQHTTTHIAPHYSTLQHNTEQCYTHRRVYHTNCATLQRSATQVSCLSKQPSQQYQMNANTLTHFPTNYSSLQPTAIH